jgi:hypothetical protein
MMNNTDPKSAGEGFEAQGAIQISNLFYLDVLAIRPYGNKIWEISALYLVA